MPTVLDSAFPKRATGAEAANLRQLVQALKQGDLHPFEDLLDRLEEEAGEHANIDPGFSVATADAPDEMWTYPRLFAHALSPSGGEEGHIFMQLFDRLLAAVSRRSDASLWLRAIAREGADRFTEPSQFGKIRHCLGVIGAPMMGPVNRNSTGQSLFGRAVTAGNLRAARALLSWVDDAQVANEVQFLVRSPAEEGANRRIKGHEGLLTAVCDHCVSPELPDLLDAVSSRAVRAGAHLRANLLTAYLERCLARGVLWSEDVVSSVCGQDGLDPDSSPIAHGCGVVMHGGAMLSMKRQVFIALAGAALMAHCAPAWRRQVARQSTAPVHWIRATSRISSC